MLPGHIGGFYSYSQCHIDLQILSNFAHAQLCLDHIIGLDLKNSKVLCANQPTVGFDILSINIGSTPTKLSVPGAVEYTIAAKPVAQFLEHWYQLQENALKNPQKALNIAIVGGGDVELALSMLAGVRKLEIYLFQSSKELMPSHHQSVRRIMRDILSNKDVKLHLGERVCEVVKLINKGLTIKCESGLIVTCDQVFWVTHASAGSWLKAAGIGTDDQGFILVNDNLQSVTHPHIFAAGDIAKMINYQLPKAGVFTVRQGNPLYDNLRSMILGFILVNDNLQSVTHPHIFAAGDIAKMINHQLPKAGVFAVRQGNPLYDNLRSMILGESLKPYKPQTAYFGLIITGDGRELANRGILLLPSHQLWWCWKDCIDRNFIAQFPHQ
jgi:NADH dehydrogenase FAD-containing subunit